MTAFKKITAFLLAIGVAAFSLPAVAGGSDYKKYKLNITPASVDAGKSGVSMNAALTNGGDDDDGSTIKSFKLYAPAGITITGAAVASPYSGQVTVSGGTVTVNGVSLPIKDGKTLNLTLTVNTACTFTGGDWKADVWTGSPQSGTKFAFKSYGSNVHTNLGNPCAKSITWVPPTGGSWAAGCPTSVAYNGDASCTVTGTNPGWKFTAFSANCTVLNQTANSATCKLSNVTTDQTVTASFTADAYTVSVTTNPTGVGGATCTPSSGAWGTNVSCTPNTATGYTFNSFSGACTGATCSFTLSGNATVNVNYWIIVAGTPSGGGSSTFNCTSPVAPGGSSTCTATPAPGYRVLGFTGCAGTVDGGTGAQTCTVSPVSGPVSPTANFGKVWAVSGVTDPAGKATVTCSPATVDDGGSSTCTVSAIDSAYFLGSFSQDCKPVPNTKSCTVTGVGSNTTIIAFLTKQAGTGPVGCTSTDNYVASSGVSTPAPTTVDPDLTYVDLANVNSRDWGIRRGPNYVTNDCPAKVGVSLTTDGTTSFFTYDKTTGQNGAFKYTVVWDAVYVESTGLDAGWTSKRPKLAWVTTDWPATTGTPDYVPALACRDDDLSQGEGLLPTIPNVAPFNTYPAAHPYYPGKLARMCVAMHGWISAQPTPYTGSIPVVYFTKVVDESDGWMSID